MHTRRRLVAAGAGQMHSNHRAAAISATVQIASTSCGKSGAGYASTPAGLLKEAEHGGYRSAPQPVGIALALKEYQLQTLAWMQDRESLPNLGLNSIFLEQRRWGGRGAVAEFDDPEYNVACEPTYYANNDCSHFYYFPGAGEIRIEKPARVRGGVLAEEMGMGKTLEIVSLISNDMEAARADVKAEDVVDYRERAAATLIVVPEPLLNQWVAEIAKSCGGDAAQIRVETYCRTQLRGTRLLRLNTTRSRNRGFL